MKEGSQSVALSALAAAVTLPPPASTAAMPDRLLPTVRLRPIIVAVAVFFSLLLLVGPLAVAVAALIFAPAEVGLPVALTAVAFAAVMAYAMSPSLQWVELDGDVIRGRRLLTRRIVEQQVGDLVDAKALHSKALGPELDSVLDALLQTSNRGYQLHFRDGSRIALIRADIAGLDVFLGALARRLRKVREEGEPVG